MAWNNVKMVYHMQDEVLKKVFADLPETKDVTYFSVDCANQRRNRRINLICVNIVLNSEIIYAN